MRHQFVLDKKSNRILDELAESRGGNRSLVVREAIGVYADLEEYLEKIEADPKFIEMMERSAADIREGRGLSQEEAELYVARKQKAKIVARIVWSPHVLDVIAELPPRESDLIFEKTKFWRDFPGCSQCVRRVGFGATGGCSQGTGSSTIRSSDDTAYIRILWPAQIP